MLREQSGCCRACRSRCGSGSGCISSLLNFVELFLVICLQFQPRWLPPQHPEHRLLNLSSLMEQKDQTVVAERRYRNAKMGRTNPDVYTLVVRCRRMTTNPRNPRKSEGVTET